MPSTSLARTVAMLEEVKRDAHDMARDLYPATGSLMWAARICAQVDAVQAVLIDGSTHDPTTN
jgi:hypothetical protein